MPSRLITLYTVPLIPRLSQFQFLKKGRDFRKWPTSPDLCDAQSRQPAASVPKRSFARFAVAYCEVKIAFGIMPWMPLVPSTTWVI